MKKLLLLITILSTGFINAQSFDGKGDKKLQIGANLQEFSTGINASLDYGLAQNISVGVSSSYALNVSDRIDADFVNRFDVKLRLNANLSDVINVSDALDVYPGLSVSTKNFGGHIGVRYFFTDGFGVYSEFNTTLARYDNVKNPAEIIHNQFTVNMGLCFNL